MTPAVHARTAARPAPEAAKAKAASKHRAKADMKRKR
jgi:hypothetical protein